MDNIREIDERTDSFLGDEDEARILEEVQKRYQVGENGPGH